ncbi:Arc family DNA-binding protein [Undibacterium sp.]|uniref:Arc family DNA-binding protein n=1 Tax=Undibacterium sp. TaxID=1914977 RepID=UPI00374CCAB9
MNKSPPPPSRTADQFVLRLPEGMRDRIASVAKDANRSMNAEIIGRLEATFKNSSITSDKLELSEELMDSYRNQIQQSKLIEELTTVISIALTYISKSPDSNEKISVISDISAAMKDIHKFRHSVINELPKSSSEPSS